MPQKKQITAAVDKLMLLNAHEIEKMRTYNYAGFVGHAFKRGDFYVIEEITGKTAIVGHGQTIDEALSSFEDAVKLNLRETSHDSQKKALKRKFAKAELIHARVNSIHLAEQRRKNSVKTRLD